MLTFKSNGDLEALRSFVEDLPLRHFEGITEIDCDEKYNAKIKTAVNKFLKSIKQETIK